MNSDFAELSRRALGRDFARLPTFIREPLVRSKRRYLKRKSFESIKGARIDPVGAENFTEKLMLRVLQDRPVPYYELIENKITAPWYARSKTDRPLEIAQLYGYWRHPTVADLEALPNEFVLKLSHGSGSTRIIRDRDSADLPVLLQKIESNRRTLRDHIGNRFNAVVLAEELLHGPGGGVPRDLKFHCFNRPDGTFEWILQVISGRYSEPYHDMLDSDLRPVPWYFKRDRSSDGPIDLPKNIDEFAAVARDLSAEFDYVRIDLYEVDGRVVFGEFTPTPAEADHWIGPDGYEAIVGAKWSWDPYGRLAGSAAPATEAIRLRQRPLGPTSHSTRLAPIVDAASLSREVSRLRRRYALQARFMLESRRRVDLRSPGSFSEKLIARNLSVDAPPLTEVWEDRLTARHYVEHRLPGVLRYAERHGAWSPEASFDGAGIPLPFLLRGNFGDGVESLVESHGAETTAWRNVRHRLASATTSRGDRYQPFILAEGVLSNADGSAPTMLGFHCFHRSDGSFDWVLRLRSSQGRDCQQIYNSKLDLIAEIGDDVSRKPPRPAVEAIEPFVSAAKALSSGYDHVFVDLLDLDGTIYFDSMSAAPLDMIFGLERDDLDQAIGQLWEWAFEGVVCDSH